MTAVISFVAQYLSFGKQREIPEIQVLLDLFSIDNNDRLSAPKPLVQFFLVEGPLFSGLGKHRVQKHTLTAIDRVSDPVFSGNVCY